MNASRPGVGVGAVVLDEHMRVLLGHRIKAGETATWCLPGGHLEAGEPFETAAARATEEEAGLVITRPVTFAVAVRTDGSGVVAGVVAEGAGAPVVRGLR
jgi:8-oxo-dGTP diphosphatase